MRRRAVIKTLVFLAVLCSLSFKAFADEVVIPFAIYEKDFKKDAKDKGFDLYGERESQGFVRDEGNRFKVFTYKKISLENLDLIKELTWKNIRK